MLPASKDEMCVAKNKVYVSTVYAIAYLELGNLNALENFLERM